MRFIATLLLLLSSLLVSSRSSAQEAQPSEYQVKSAFIFNFAKFIEWPPGALPDAKTPFVIGVLGDNPFGDDLEKFVRDKTLNGHAIAVKPCSTADDAKKCHILFVSTSEKKRLPEIFESLAGANILTVGETENFIKSGGIINFFREGNRIRFEINDAAAKKVTLKIDTKLLGLAKRPAT